MYGSTKLLIVLAIIASIALALPCSAVTWDFKADFSTIGKTSGELANPNGDWSYGWAATANPFVSYTFNPFTGFGVDRGSGITAYPWNLATVWVVWSPSTTNSEVPAIYYNNKTTLDASKNATATSIAAKDIAIFPGLTSDKRKAIVRWTAPGTGSYNVSATFTRYTADWRGANNDDNDVYVFKNATSPALLSTSVGGGASDIATYTDAALSLNAGDTLDFVIGYGVTADTATHACNLGVTIVSAGTAGIASGQITAATGGAPIAGATVESAGGNRSTTTDASGNYSLTLMPGANSLKISKLGYVTQTIAVTTPSAGNNAQLVSCGTVTGTVTAGGLPVNRAKVAVTGGTEFTYTAANGTYSLPLPAGTYNLTASKNQFSSQNVTGVSVTTGGSASQNFTISVNAGAIWPAHSGFNKENPNDCWTYGNAPDASPFTGYAFSAYSRMFVCSQSAWFGADNSLVALTGGPYSYMSGWPFGDNWIVQRPAAATKSITRFTAPVAGWYTINGGWVGGWAGTMDWSVVKDASTVLMSGSGASGISPTLYTGVNLSQGGTIDFCIGDSNDGVTNDYTELVATVSYGVSGVAGWVRDTGGNPIAGAKVQCGVDSTTSAADGTYTLPTSTTGAVTVTVTKPGFENYSVAATVTAGSLTTVNVTMTTSGLFTGRVLGKPAPGTAIAGATLQTPDGAGGHYTLTSASDGSFSGIITSGTRTFRVYKFGFVANLVTLTIPPAGLNQDIMMTKGWNLAAEFGSADTSQPRSTVSGPWAYAYDLGTFTSIMHYYGPTQSAWYESWVGAMSTMGGYGAWVRNPSFVIRPKTDNVRGVAEEWALITHPGYQNNNGWSGNKTVARFTAPESGYFDVDLRLTARTDHDQTVSVDGTTSQITYKKNGATVFSGKLNGYVGTPAVGYTDSFGTAPVLTYSVAEPITAGDILDLEVSGDNSGWTGVDFTVSAKSASYITGVVTSDRPGNPPIVEALVTAAGGGTSYTTQTDETGRYWLALPPGEYEMDVTRPGHSDTGGGNAVVTVAAGGSETQDFSLHFKYEWDAAADFSSVHNPNGEWSYGYEDGALAYALRAQSFTLYTNYRQVYLPEFSGWTINGNGWDGGFGINRTGGPVTGYAGTEARWYVEAGQFWQQPGGSAVGYGSHNATLRWTAPKDMVVNINATWKSQLVPGHLENSNGIYAQLPVVTKNGAIMTAPQLDGFVGRSVNGFTDSVAPHLPMYQTQETFQTALPVNSGDTLDFTLDWNTIAGTLLWGLDVDLSEGSGQSVSTIAQVKALADDTTVFMTTPVQLGTGTFHTAAGQEGSFSYRYGTPPVPEKSFYVQSNDRLQGLRCVVPAGGLPSLGPNTKITFSGVVDTDAFGQKVVRVGSINSYEESDYPKPFGKVGKTLTNTGVLTRVWGKIVSKTDNPNPVMSENPVGSGLWWKDYAYEYITINDGSQNINVLMHVQGEYFSDYDAWVRDLTVGDYIGVTGIASTTTGTDAVIMPRTSTDIRNYTDLGL